MWVFYMLSLPLTMGMVVLTLRYFAGPDVPKYVLFTVGYAWFCSLSIIILVPADIWTTIIGHSSGGISFFWGWSYWGTFLLTWAVVPTIQGYEDAGDFTMRERLKTSIHGNLVFYFCVGFISLLGLVLLILLRKNWSGGILGLAMACSNTFGLVTGAFLLGFALSEIPKEIWKNADWSIRQKVLSHKVARMVVKLDDAHQDFSNAIVVAQATSNQMSKRDPLRPYMNVIDKMLHQMLKDDPLFKPQGGRLGENDMDYDTDEKSMATLRRHLRIAREEYYRCKSEYMNFVLEALELEDTIKNYEQRHATGWKYISRFRPERTGTLVSFLDMIEFIWRCILKKQLVKVLAMLLGVMSVAILLAEATILPSGVDLSLFSILVNAVGKQEMLVQVAAFVPLMYMCVCTYYSLFKIGMLMFYSLTPRQTSSVSLLMICSMVARYAPPISYNFLNLIHLDGNKKTIFEERMGNIDDAVPFFGKGFNKIYPLIMVIYTILIASNFFDRIINYFGHWKIFKFQDEADDTDGFDPSGLIILQKERYWLEQGHKIGEHVIPLARNFNNMGIEVEAGNNTDKFKETKATNVVEDGKKGHLKPLREEAQLETTREAIGKKYTIIQGYDNEPASKMNSSREDDISSSVDMGNSQEMTTGLSSRLASRWDSMLSGFQYFRSNIGAQRVLPLPQTQETAGESHIPLSVQSLDEIFERLKQPALDQRNYDDDDDNEGGF